MSFTSVAASAVVDASPHSPLTIEAENIVKVFGGHRVVDGVSFTVRRGEVLGFLGPNGAGKTTTMRILAGYMPATSGRAAIAGHDVARDSFRARSNLGYLPESVPLYLSMTVRGYLNFMCEIKRHSSTICRSHVNRSIEECGLEEVHNRRIGNLSKGFRQRVGLAQAILGDPPVLILDEPTVGLDPRQISDIRNLIKTMAGHRTVLLSTHILPEVSMTCQKVIVIDRGRIVASGTPEKLVSTIERDEAVLVTIGGELERVKKGLERIPGVDRVEVERKLSDSVISYRLTTTKGEDPRKEIARAVIVAKLDLLEMTKPGLTLEDVFLHVISSPEGA